MAQKRDCNPTSLRTQMIISSLCYYIFGLLSTLALDSSHELLFGESIILWVPLVSAYWTWFAYRDKKINQIILIFLLIMFTLGLLRPMLFS